MKEKSIKKYDYIAIIEFLIVLYLNSKYATIESHIFSYNYFIVIGINLIIFYVVGLSLSFFMAKSHIISAQYFWRWANLIAILVASLILYGAMQ